MDEGIDAGLWALLHCPAPFILRQPPDESEPRYDWSRFGSLAGAWAQWHGAPLPERPDALTEMEREVTLHRFLDEFLALSAQEVIDAHERGEGWPRRLGLLARANALAGPRGGRWRGIIFGQGGGVSSP